MRLKNRLNKKVNKKEIVQLKENEVKEILKENLDSIFNVFVSLGEEHNWNNANQADFNIIKPQCSSLCHRRIC